MDENQDAFLLHQIRPEPHQDYIAALLAHPTIQAAHAPALGLGVLALLHHMNSAVLMPDKASAFPELIRGLVYSCGDHLDYEALVRQYLRHLILQANYRQVVEVCKLYGLSIGKPKSKEIPLLDLKAVPSPYREQIEWALHLKPLPPVKEPNNRYAQRRNRD